MLVSACVVCRLQRFARYLGRREGGRGGGETGKQKALLIGSLSSSLHRDGGGESRLFPPLRDGVTVLVISANQNTANGKHTDDLRLRGVALVWVKWPARQASGLAECSGGNGRRSG